MPKIRIDINSTPRNGRSLTFKAPADCADITGLIVYYPEGDTLTSKEFNFVDAHGVDVGSDTISLFSANSLVKVILDMDNANAYVQNADTNAYLEGELAKKYSPDNKPSPEDIAVTDEDNGKIIRVVDGKAAWISADEILPIFTIGDVITLENSEMAMVGITGTKENVVLNFAIPKGKDGRNGVDAPSGDGGGVGDLVGRVSTLETKVKNMAEDIVYVYEEIDPQRMCFQGDPENFEMAVIVADAIYNIRPTEYYEDEAAGLQPNMYKHKLISQFDMEAYVQSALDALLNE